MDSIDAGRLRHVVTLQTFTVSETDSRGHPVGSWETEAELRAGIEPVGPRDADVVNQLYHEASHVVWMHYHPSIARDKRLSYDGRLLHIGHVANMGETNRVLKLLCSEVV